MNPKQLFISYKSQNADVVRRVVESLLTVRTRVWFAEYQVLAENYDLFQQKVDDEINAAIDASDSAVIFTNNVWAASPYCRNEIERIIVKIPLDRVVQVCIPKEDQPAIHTPLLEKVPTIEFRDGRFQDVIEFVANHLGLSQPDASYKLPPHSNFLTRFGPLRIGTLERAVLPSTFSRVARSHLFRFAGTIHSLPVRLDVNVNPYQTAVSQLPSSLQEIAKWQTLSPASVTDDRKIYQTLRHKAKEWYQNRSIFERGLHLFHWNGKGQMALTFQQSDQNRGITWNRIYTLLVADAASRSVGEVDLEFEVPFFMSLDEGLTFPEFCKLLPVFDEIASSFEYRGDLVEVQNPNPILSIIFYVAGVAAGLALTRYLFALPASTQILGAAIGMFLLGGYFRHYATKLSLRRRANEENYPAWDPSEMK